jgi:hypothetical protein
MVPYARTADGFESHFGINHLGTFALTGLLLPQLLASSAARVVTVSSEGQRFARFDFDNLNHGAKREWCQGWARDRDLWQGEARQRHAAGRVDIALAPRTSHDARALSSAGGVASTAVGWFHD